MATGFCLERVRNFYREKHGISGDLEMFSERMEELDKMDFCANSMNDGELRQWHFPFSIGLRQEAGWAENGDWGIPQYYTVLYDFALDQLAEFEKKYSDRLGL